MRQQTVRKKLLCVDNLRHAEYYGIQSVFDDLYAQGKDGEVFTDLMTLILSRENILLAYRNIKTNAGSKTAGTDGLTISQFFTEGEMVELTPELKELFDSWVSLTPEQKAAAQQMLRAMNHDK